MLKKLIKYDFMWINKIIVYFEVIALILAVLSKFTGTITDSVIGLILDKIVCNALICCIISIIINNLIRCWVRFIRYIYKDEAYLTHTLPISRGKIYTSKILSSILSLITSLIVIAICILIGYLDSNNIEILKNILSNSQDVGILILVCIVFVLEMIFTLLVGLIGIIIGHKSNNAKIVCSIVSGILMYGLLSSLLVAIMYVFALVNPSVMDLFNNNVASFESIKLLLEYSAVIYLLYNVILFVLGKKMLYNGIDVE